MSNKIQKIVHPAAGALTILTFLSVVYMLWQWSYAVPDRLGLSRSIHTAVRASHKTDDLQGNLYAYVGNTKHKIFHAFKAKCARDVGPKRLTGFDTQDAAASAGYMACNDCIDSKKIECTDGEHQECAKTVTSHTHKKRKGQKSRIRRS